MKNFIMLMCTLVFSLITFISCEKDEAETPSNPIALIANHIGGAANQPVLNVTIEEDTVLSFINSSINESGVTWTVDNNATILTEGVDVLRTENFGPFIVPGTTATSDRFNVFYSEAGTYTLTATLVFGSPVSFFHSAGEIEAVEENGQWVLDVPYTITVTAAPAP